MRVLFIGNSHTYYNDMPQIFAMLCEKSGVSADVTMLAHGGMGWDFHEKEPEVRFNIRYGGYDAVVLQHTAHPMGDLSVMEKSGAKLIRWVKEAGARPVLYMTWAAECDGMDAQPAMSEAYRKLSGKYGAALAPVGDVWWAFHGLSPETALYADDGQHASPAGSRLAAYTIASVTLNRPADALYMEDETVERIAQAVMNYVELERE